MKILFINHYFEQDIKELMAFKKEEHEFHCIAPGYFAREVKRFLPIEVFDGLLNYYKPQFEEKRKKLNKTIEKSLYLLYQTYQFDIIISPSDTFFYIRPLIAACHNLGVPFFVAQKETTISPGTMEKHSLDIGKYFPFISDYMTVCSDNHKEFWLRANTPENLIEVTGQPRFDFYYRMKQNVLKKKYSSELFDNNKKNILFFTYELDAYLEITKDYGSWKELREQTENSLVTLAKEGKHNILIKPHPQHNLNDVHYFTSRIQKNAGAEGFKNIKIIDRSLDARELIMQADIIVAFQTTALLEALAIGKKVIYTFWGQAAHKSKSFVLPFHEFPELLDVVHSPEELLERIRCENKGVIIDKEVMNKRLELFNKYLGPFDGLASKRTWKAIDKILKKYSNLNAGQKQKRNLLLEHKKISLLREQMFIFFLLLLLSPADLFLKKINKKNNKFKMLDNFISLIKKRKDELKKCKNGQSLSLFQITGPINTGYFSNKMVNYFLKKL